MTTTSSTQRAGHGLGAHRFLLRPYPVQVGPTTHLAAEAERLAALTWEHFDVKRLGATVGAELHGPDLTTDLPDEVIAEIARALAEYKVVFFRDQPITPAQHVAFARRDAPPLQAAIMRLRRSSESGSAIGAGLLRQPSA